MKTYPPGTRWEVRTPFALRPARAFVERCGEGSRVVRISPSRRAEVEMLQREVALIAEGRKEALQEWEAQIARAEAAEKRVAELGQEKAQLASSLTSRAMAAEAKVRELEERLAKCAELHGYAAQLSAARLEGADAARREALAILARWLSPELLECVKRDIKTSLGKEPKP